MAKMGFHDCLSCFFHVVVLDGFVLCTFVLVSLINSGEHENNQFKLSINAPSGDKRSGLQLRACADEQVAQFGR